MINIESLLKPTVLLELDYNKIKQANIDELKKLDPEWEHIESDDFMPNIEANAYRELHLRQEFNQLALAFFLATATKADLDHWGVIFDCERLKGSKPWANYTFSLSEAKSSDITINKGLALADDESKYEARLLEDIVIKKGELEAVGRVELQVYTSSSDVQTNNITTTLPYILSAKAASEFKAGSNVESDDDFRFRILLSMSDKSTAGSSTTYKSYAYKADERIEDIKVVNGLKDFSTYIPLFLGKNEVEIIEGIRNLIADFCTVIVYYYSQNADALMQQRIEEILNSDTVRPMTDYVKVIEATPKLFQVEAILNCEKNQEYGLIQTQALENLTKNLIKLRKIGESITLSEINDFLRVGGVKEVVILEPTENVTVLSHEIGVCDEFNISTATI
ncbi:baseplate J/gp47 family protein [Arcobacter cryaerophilus gv. pseudocryaerophilus]|uniref:Baseplate J/gp47 family protein n=3 Tax=Arcobacteraceae TaxID=2808963 RepID=A0AA96DUR7_9BACT|nr:baseplate J/gp47 family protein [Arcobacter sp. AZ-2023]WNL36459.1 baseplate J/gp47 family protein [Arcobacter sp. AZ-2023]WPD12175.1 baseplate J/gp47 family protein [Arcobacter sp. DSM 115960]